MKRVYKFTVTLRLAEDDYLTKSEAKAYVREAVQGYRGMYSPDSAIFKLTERQITVTQQP